jgi:hypothetical protein
MIIQPKAMLPWGETLPWSLSENSPESNHPHPHVCGSVSAFFFPGSARARVPSGLERRVRRPSPGRLRKMDGLANRALAPNAALKPTTSGPLVEAFARFGTCRFSSRGSTLFVRQHYTLMKYYITLILLCAVPAFLFFVFFVVVPRFRMERRARALLAQHPGAEQTSFIWSCTRRLQVVSNGRLMPRLPRCSRRVGLSCERNVFTPSRLFRPQF